MKGCLFLITLLSTIFSFSSCDSQDDELCGRQSFKGTWQGKFVTTAFRADSVQSETSYEAELDFEDDGSVLLPASFQGTASYNWYIQSDPPVLVLQFDGTSQDTNGIQVIGGQDFVYEIEGCNSNTKTLMETREASDQDPNDFYLTTLVLKR